MKKLTTPEVTKDIREIISPQQDLVKAIGIFGSLARGDYHDESDIDLIVEYNSLSEFSMELYTNFCALCNLLEERLTKTYNRKVDIVHIENGTLESLLNKSVESEVVWL